MKRLFFLIVVAAVLSLSAVALASPQGRKPFVAPLSGGEEVTETPVETAAHGLAIFRLNKEGDELSYKLIVANIENVTQAHIHMALPGQNGPVVAWLYPSGPPPVLVPGPFSGVLAEGTITEENLVGLLAGQSLSELIALLETGTAYVNVHTEQYPAGEIRGQIR